MKELPVAKSAASERSAKPLAPSEMHASVSTARANTPWRRFLAFAGPAYMVSVGYMDPGNWATDLAGGAKFGYALLFVILASNLMAILLQTLCLRLGIATGLDLAQACRVTYKKPANIALWILCEIAIIACDLAEVVGSAVALNMLFGWPLEVGVLVTGLDVIVLLGLMNYGFRKLEALIMTLVATVGGCFALEVFLGKPDWGAVARGTFIPSMPSAEAFAIAIGILGATVMPHNLYLHSAIVQTRAIENTTASKRQAIRYNTLDTVLALGMAFFVNAAILVVAAAVFHKNGQFDIERLEDAHKMLTPLLGSMAATAFAVALLASGQSSTITGTLAGQIVMEGFLNIRIKPWLRRIITRGLAIVPAILLIHMSGGKNTVGLLVMSQIVLSMQLPFAIFPLLMFTSDRKKMGDFVNPMWLRVLGFGVCFLIAALNLYLLFTQIGALWFSLAALIALGFSMWVMFFYKEKTLTPEASS
jgi:manganese transport protein